MIIIYILGIESSCDETAAAVIRDGTEILSSVVASQTDIHAVYGGVVPEIASRAHTEAISGITDSALKQAGLTMRDIGAVAVTNTPGLIGALLVGVGFAKALAYSWNIPLVGVHHIKGHIAAAYLTPNPPSPPFTALAVSGGHTSILRVDSYTSFTTIGSTRDDAAGECFDKAGRVMGLPYPAGKLIDELAGTGDASRYPLPEVNVAGHELDFSFSGLKTATVNLVHGFRQRGEDIPVADICAVLTKRICEGIVKRADTALSRTGHKTLVAAGGVMANSHIRRALQELADRRGAMLCVPPVSLCGDNAAMIAAQGWHELNAGNVASMSLNAYATTQL
ncbi:MAG: tRNA (adenosine(37)-N6)-threonylcarbamoyltransferase complex transferase subunit TsaD [Eubacteriales bacterium]